MSRLCSQSVLCGFPSRATALKQSERSFNGNPNHCWHGHVRPANRRVFGLVDPLDWQGFGIMAYNYEPLIQTAARLITEFGQTGAIRRPSLSGDAWNPTVTATDYGAVLAVMKYPLREIDGTLILSDDRKVYVKAGADVTPSASDKLVIGGAEFEIISVETIAPSGVNLVHIVQVRR